MGAIRGAICAENTAEDISAKAVELVKEIYRANNLQNELVSAIIFSASADLNACYPAKEVRRFLGENNVAFMCLEEMAVQNSLEKCLRVCVIAEGLPQKQCKHVYLGKAAVLRPDLR